MTNKSKARVLIYDMLEYYKVQVYPNGSVQIFSN